MVEKIFAQTPFPLGNIGGTALGPFGNNASSLLGQNGAEKALVQITGAISSIIGIMTVCAAIWFLFQFLVGGIGWITSGGEKTKLAEARDRITHAFIGLIIVIAGWAILALVGQFFGYNIFINPGEVIQQLGIPQ
jgi:hypothetical protein